MKELYNIIAVNSQVELLDSTVLIVLPAEAIGLTGTLTNYANAILEWCNEFGVDADFRGQLSHNGQRVTEWDIKDAQQRMLFTLRWA
jgi:hypothetical protein